MAGRRALAIAVAVLALSGCGLPAVTFDVTPTTAAAGSARAALDELPVKGRAPKTGYSRDEFGQRWADTDRNGCDQRNDVLARDLVNEQLRDGGCVVLSGTLHSPYTGATVPFLRGPDTSDDVQIDHVVSLSNAWQTGAQQLTPDERERFGNDLLNLQAVEGSVNARKSDGDSATWLPPSRAGWCRFVAIQIATKQRYHLWVTAPERDAMARVLDTCPDQPLPDGGTP